MAIIHPATLRPSKLELVASRLPGRPWGVTAELEQVAAYRFDDPAGQVGTETFVLRAGDTSLHVPLTYRGPPVRELAEHPVGTTEQSVLGRRWCHDGCADPVHVAAPAEVALTDRPQSEQPVVTDSADATTVHTGDLEPVVRRVLDPAATAGGATLTGTWDGRSEPVLPATARRV